MPESKHRVDQEEEKRELWRLYDSENRVFFNNLSAAQLYKITDSIPEKEMRFWHVCKDGDEDWYPLLEKLNEINRLEKSRPSGILSLEEFINETAQTGSFLKTSLKGIEKRKINRVRTSLKVYIDVGDTILEAETKDISLFSIKLDKRFPLLYKGRFYPLTLKAKPPITLRCSPLISEKEQIRGTWNIVTLDPNFNLSLLAIFLNRP